MNPTNSHDLPRIQQILSKGSLGAIVLPTRPTADAVNAATALYFGLIKLGKTVTIVASDKVDMDIIGAEKIQQDIVSSGDNLVISFPYNEGAIDKVDYNIQGNYFNLVVTPRVGYPKLDPKQVKYGSSGGQLDFIITIDSPTLQSLGAIYGDNQTQFQGKDIINIDRHLTNAFFGTVNYVNKTASSVSEIMFRLLQELKIELDKNIATNLYAGIAGATNNFTSYSVNAETFDIAAQLLRMGAIKKTVRKPMETPMVTNGFAPRPFYPQPQGRSNPEVQSYDKQGTSEEESIGNTPTSAAPQDWLKPKIFKGNDLM